MKIKKTIRITLMTPISPATHQSQLPSDRVTTKNLEAKSSSTEANSISQVRKSKEATPLQKRQSPRTLITTRAKEKSPVADHFVLISECTPLQGQSKIHRCSESASASEKWQAASRNTYEGVFDEVFQNLDQRSEFQKDRDKIIQLISAQEAIYTLLESTDKESEMQKKEQLRISLEIDRLFDKNQGIMGLLGDRQIGVPG